MNVYTRYSTISFFSALFVIPSCKVSLKQTCMTSPGMKVRACGSSVENRYLATYSRVLASASRRFSEGDGYKIHSVIVIYLRDWSLITGRGGGLQNGRGGGM